MPKMKSASSSLRRICQHLLALGISTKEANRFTSLVDKWTRDSGPEWTVKRVKSLKTSMVEMLATGQEYKVPIGWATRTNRKGRTIFRDGLLHEMFTQAHNNLKVASAFLRLYQAIELETLSKEQQAKMEKAIESPPSISIAALLEAISSFKMRPIKQGEVVQLLEVGRESPTLMHCIGGGKRAPTFQVSSTTSWTYAGSRDRSSASCFDFEEYFTHDRAMHALWSKYPSEVSNRLIGNDSYPFIDIDGLAVHDIPCGTLVALQEGGCKVRWIANPILPIQVLGEPLKDKLFAYSKMAYPEIQTDDQDSGRQAVVEWLSEQRTVYSYDCTSFTDRFPLKLQEFALLQMQKQGFITEFDIDAFALVMNKGWYSPHMRRTVRWAVGQPLGYGPSFHLATLSHAMVLDNLDERKTGLWRVVGDDVVIADEALAKAYQNFMSDIAGVEINLSKSVISAKIAEFLGKLIQSGGVVPSIKVKLFEHPDQVKQAIAFYGEEALQVLSKKQKELALQCFLPEHLGGLGIMPSGMSYADYLSKLNLTRIANASIRDDMSDFHGSDPTGARTQLQSLMTLKAEILARNTQTISLLGLAEINQHLGEGTLINEMTRLPTLNPRDESLRRALVRSQPGWVELNDKAWLLYSSHSPSQHVFQTPLNAHGYVDHRELASTLVGDSLNFTVLTNERKSYHDSQFHSKHLGYFLNWKEFLKGLCTANE